MGLINKIKKSFTSEKKRDLSNLDLDSLNISNIPLMHADEIINILSLHNKLRALRKKIALDDARFDMLYLNPLKLYMESAQLIPASLSHHHSQIGGLIIHTIQVIETAINIREQYALPQLADPDIQQKERHLWTYGVFVATLMHDAGKLLTQQKLVLNDHSFFDPINPNIRDIGYKMQPLHLQDGYRIHETVGLLFFGNFIPLIGQSWLSSNIKLLDQIFSYLKGDERNQGIIGQIVSSADSKSAASDVGFEKTVKLPFSKKSFGEKLMMATTEVAKNLTKNRSGAPIYIKHGYAWVMSKILADNVRKHMQDLNENVPHSNNNLFTEYQNGGYAIHNGRNGISLSIDVKQGEWQNKFNVIAFKVETLFPEGGVEDFDGLIHCLTVPELTPNDNQLILMQKSSPALNLGELDQSETIDSVGPTIEDDTFSDESIFGQQDSTEPDIAIDEPIFEQDDSTEPNVTIDETTFSQNDSFGSTDDFSTEPMFPEDNDIRVETTVKSDDEPEEYKHDFKVNKRDNFDRSILPELPPNINLQSDEIIDLFLSWITEMIRHKRFILNDKTSPIHILTPEIMGLMAPKAFIFFLQDYGLENELKVNNFQTKFYRYGHAYQYKRAAGRTVHVFPAKMINNESIRISFVLIPVNLVMPHGMDISINKSLMLTEVPLPPNNVAKRRNKSKKKQ